MGRFGRGQPFKVLVATESTDWLQFFKPVITTVSAGLAAAAGLASPRQYIFRADACGHADVATPVCLLQGSAAATGAALNASGVAGIVVSAGAANATGTAYNASTGQIQWTTGDAITWTTGDTMTWVTA